MTPLGSPAGWPQSLRTAVGILLHSGYPMYIAWGPEFIQLYNDAYRPILGSTKHPAALGESTYRTFSEIWDFIGPMFREVLQTRTASTYTDQLLPLNRHGYVEECYFTFSYSAILDDDGNVGGVFVTVLETTDRVLRERRIQILRDLTNGPTRLSVQEICRASAEVLARNPKDAPFVALYVPETESRAKLTFLSGLETSHRAIPAILEKSSSVWPLDELRTGGVKIFDLDPPVQAGADWPWPEPVASCAGIAISAAGQIGPKAILVVGLSPRCRFDAEYEDYLRTAAANIGTVIAEAEAFENEKRRAEALAEIDRAKTVFFSNVSHEFRTPLTLILGPLHDALSDPELSIDDEQRRQLEAAHRNSLRLLKLVNTLLDFSRIEAGRTQAVYEETELSGLTAELASNFRSACERAGVDLIVECQAIAAPTYVDRDMWEKIVLNLLSNAFKFTFEGRIAVSLRHVEDKVVLAVRDTGIGIPADDLNQIFERFHRVTGAHGRTHEGTGIGLALVHELVKLHGGSVQVESRLGEGSTFTISIPIGKAHLPADRIGSARGLVSTALGAEPFVEEALRWLPAEESDFAGREKPPTPAAAFGGAEQAGAAREAARGRILWADDNADMREYVERLLSPLYDVQSVADGAAALAAALPRPPDLILADVMMPRLDGFALLRKLRADPATRAVPVILLSARAGDESRIEGLETGADDYLVKPFSARELLARITVHLEMARVRRESESQIRFLEEHRRLAMDSARLGLWDCWNLTGDEIHFDERCREILGLTSDGPMSYHSALHMMHPEDRSVFDRTLRDAMDFPEGGEFRGEYRVLRPSGEQGWVSLLGAVYVRAKEGLQKERYRVSGIIEDISARKRNELIVTRQKQALELIGEGAPLGAALERLTASVEELVGDDVAASILLLDSDGERLHHGAGNSLPESYRNAIDGLAIGPNVGSCGTAAHTGKTVVVSDIARDPLWEDFREVALRHDLRACWSTPIFSSDGQVLGTFAIYHSKPRDPTPRDKELLEILTKTAAIAIERARAELRLTARNARLALLSEALEHLLSTQDSDGMVRQLFAKVASHLGVDTYLNYMVNPDGDALSLHSCAGISEHTANEMRRLEFGQAICGTVAQLRRPLVATDIQTTHFDKADLARGLGIQAYACNPLMSGGRLLGTLSFASRTRPRFDADELEFMQLISRYVAVAVDRANADKDLREREAYFREMTQNLPIVVWTLTAEGAVEFVNDIWLGYSGQSLDQVRSNPSAWMACLHPDDLETTAVIFRDGIRSREPFSFESRFRRADGSHRWHLNRFLPLANGRSSGVGFIGTSTDIDDLKSTETALRESHQRYHALVQASTQIVWTIGSDGLVRQDSPSWRAFTGQTYEQWKDDGWLAAIYHDDRQRIKEAWFKGIAECVPVQTEYRLWHEASGQWRWVAVNAVPIREADGRIREWIGTNTDITDRKLAELDKEKFFKLIESSSNFIGIADLSFVAIYLNPAGMRMVGLETEEQVRGAAVQDFLFPEDHAFVFGEFLPRVFNEGRAEVEIRFRHFQSGEPIWMIWNVFCLPGKDGRPAAIATASRDITARKMMEEQLQQLNAALEERVAARTRELRMTQDALLRDLEERKRLEEQLLQVQKMESLGTLAGGIAHDFNNLLNIIQGYAFKIDMEGASNPEVSESAKIINDTVRRGAALVQQLLTLARKGTLKFETVQINGLVDQLIAMLTQTFPKTISVSADLQAGLPAIFADPNQINQALLNLCVNARDAMPNGGRLTLSTRLVRAEDLRRLGDTVAQEYLCIAVRDNGVGMDDSIKGRLFEPFFTTKDTGQGTGLGLSVVYGIMKTHQGLIDVESRLNGGACFNLYLPVVAPADASVKDGSAAPGSAVPCEPNRSATILLVDDETLMLDLVAKTLRRQGYRVLTASDGEMALDVYRRHLADVDAVLLDIGLPKVAGQDVLLQMKEAKADTVFMIASGYLEPRLREEMAKLGVAHFLEKPYLPNQILEIIRYSLEQKSPAPALQQKYLQ